MSIKPVLVPDHDAAELRKLMDTFSEATTGPTRQQLAESRAAVAAAQGVTEGVADTRQLLQDYAGLYYNSRESAGNDMDYDAIQREMDQIEQQIAQQYGPAGVKKLQKYGYEQYHGRGSFDDDVVRESGVAEEQTAAAFKPGDRVLYMNKFATIIAQDGDAYGIRIDAQPGTMKVPASQIRKPSYDESVAESIDPVEQLRADIRRFAL